jgi:hypothetical protein
MFNSARLLRPTFPVSRVPPMIGTGVPLGLSPIVRLKNGTILLVPVAGGPI